MIVLPFAIPGVVLVVLLVVWGLMQGNQLVKALRDRSSSANQKGGWS